MNALRSILKRPLSLQRPGLYMTSFTASGMLAYLISYYVLDITPCPVIGSSMAPALSPAYAETGACDRVLVSPWSLVAKDDNSSFSLSSLLWPFRPWFHDLRRGDVVVLRKPHNPEELSIKRVVGLPGDTIVRKRRPFEANKRRARKYGFAAVSIEIVVPQGFVWVEGDNWRDSFDSNDFGPIPINLITGRASQIIWPWNRHGPIPQRSSRQNGKTQVLEGKGLGYEAEDSWKEIYNYK